jgi:hypothetical protein
MTTPRLFNAQGLEVTVGDVVRFGFRPHVVERINPDGMVTLVTMDERKYTFRAQPKHINCVVQKDEANNVRQETEANAQDQG